MRKFRGVLSALVAHAGCAFALAAQSPTLSVSPARGAAVRLSERDLRALSLDTVSIAPHSGPRVVYRGVTLAQLLARAGSPVDSLRVGKVGWAILTTSRDGYRVVFSAAEVDPRLGPSQVWVVFEGDGKPLPPDDGPFRLVVPTDKRLARSARQVTAVRVVRVGVP